MNKKRILGTFVLAICLSAIGLFTQSCANEDYADDLTSPNSFTSQEKAHIMKLAEEYGLNITLDEKITGKKPSVKEIEAEFQAFASLKGEYEFVKLDDNTVISRKKESTPRLKSSWETGSWSDSKYAGQTLIHITVEWDLTRYPHYYSSDQVKINGQIS